jgi:hypothetical protein
MPSDINIKIGDITTAIECTSGGSDFEPPPAYRPFISNGRADIQLKLHLGTPQIDLGEQFFDGPPIWRLYRDDATSVFYIFEQYSDLRRLLVLPHQFERAELYFAATGGKFIDPFFGPTLELMMINYLARGQGVILHACGIDYRGKGLLFAGESGAGKSTLANLWNQEAGATVFSDDRTLVRQIDGELRMYGTPWHGEAKFGACEGIKLEKIFFLRHSQHNAIQPQSTAESVLQLLQCSFPPHWDATAMEYTLGFFAELATRISCNELSFRPDKRIIQYIKAL